MTADRQGERFALLARAALACVGAIAVACGTPVAATNGQNTDTAVTDAAVEIADDTGIGTDAAADIAPDGPVICGALPSPDGCPCQASAECGSGFCLETPNGLHCAAPCTTDCPVGFACTSVAKADGSSAKVCESVFAELCDPCKDNASCQDVAGAGARCVKNAGGGAYCGTGCKTSDECPPGYGCQDAQDIGGNKLKQCVFLGPAACACSQTAIANKLATPCTVSAGLAVCTGDRVCLPDGAVGAPKGGGLSACMVTSSSEAEVCDGIDNNCNGQTDEGTCDDGQPCTTDACDNSGATAKCVFTFNTLPCDADGSVCTQSDHCASGACQPGPLLSCDDQNLCTVDSCDPIVGCASLPADGTPCDADGNSCTVGDACKAGKCVAGPAKACASGQVCVTESCDSATGACVALNTDGTPCTDGNPCTTNESCAGGKCVGSPSLCDDKNSCTSDVCDPKVGCLHAALSGPCDDGSVCTNNDVCQGGGCVGVPQDATLCDDNNGCTTDACDAKLGCTHAPADGTFCYDGDDCTLGDHCKGGKCIGSSNGCACATLDDCKPQDDPNPCNGKHFCDTVNAPVGCKLNPSTVVTCETALNTQCAENVCSAGTGKCALSLKNDGLLCNADNNLCTQGDSCQGGTCTAGAPPDCNDQNACTVDACDPTIGCTHSFSAAPCNADGNACSVGDACALGVCQPGPLKICNDGEFCTYDSCDQTSGACVFEGAKISCSDNDLCTVGDLCGLTTAPNTWSCVPGAAASCDDSNPCTIDSCDPAKGCTYVAQTNVKIDCYTGAAGTQNVGICHGGQGTCDAGGKLGTCDGQQVPAATDICDGLDNDCDGVTDAGCAATTFTVRFGTVAIDGVSGDTTFLRSQFGSAWVGGAAKGSGSAPGICLGSLPFTSGKQFCW